MRFSFQYNRRFIRQLFREPLNQGHRARLLYHYFTWHLFYKFSGRSWIIKFDNGYKSIVKPYPDADAGEENIWNRNVDYYQLKFAERILKQEDYIFDAGCNVGNRTLALAHKLKGAVLIDASAHAIERVKENLRLNDLSLENYISVNLALGNHEGEISFSDFGGASTQNRVLGENEKGGILVKMTTLDILADRYSVIPAFIKIDVEGQEINVLNGAKGILNSGRVKLVMFEAIEEGSVKELEHFFEQINWKVFAITNTGLMSTELYVKDRGFNLFAVPRNDFERLFAS